MWQQCTVCAGRGHVTCNLCQGRGFTTARGVPGMSPCYPTMKCGACYGSKGREVPDQPFFGRVSPSGGRRAAVPDEPAPEGLEGEWQDAEGKNFVIEKEGASFRVHGGGLVGEARLDGRTVTIVIRIPLPIQSRCEMSPDWKRMEGVTSAFGLRVPCVFERISWPEQPCDVQSLLKEGERAQAAGSYQEAVQIYSHALKIAAATPEADDDIAVIQRMAELGPLLIKSQTHVNLLPELVVACAEGICALISRGHRNDGVCRCATVVINLAKSCGPRDYDQQKYFLQLARTGSMLLAELGAEAAVPLVCAVSLFWLQLDGAEQAIQATAAMSRSRLSSDDWIDVAVARAQAEVKLGNHSGAADGLIEALTPAPATNDLSKSRFSGLSTLIAFWPATRDGLDYWIETLAVANDAQPEPVRSMNYLVVAMGCAVTGHLERKNRIMQHVDEADIRAQARNNPWLSILIGAIDSVSAEHKSL